MRHEVTDAMNVGADEVGGASVRTLVPLPMDRLGEIPLQASIASFHGLGDPREHIAILIGDWESEPAPLVRIHSECLTGDVFGSSRCDCGDQLQQAIREMSDTGGVILYLRQEGRDIGLYNKLDAYAWQDRGLDTYEANYALNLAADPRSYEAASQMLFALGVSRCELLTNNPDKVAGLQQGGISVLAVHPTGVFVTDANRRYLSAKAQVSNHTLKLDDANRKGPSNG